MFKSAPSKAPAVEFGDRNRRGILKSLYIKNRKGATGRKKKMTNEEMISYIVETLPTLNRPDLEYFYWLMVENPT